MKIFGRLLVLTMLLAFIGCATQGGGGGESSSGGKTLTEADYKRIGIKETGN